MIYLMLIAYGSTRALQGHSATWIVIEWLACTSHMQRDIGFPIPYHTAGTLPIAGRATLFCRRCVCCIIRIVTKVTVGSAVALFPGGPAVLFRHILRVVALEYRNHTGAMSEINRKLMRHFASPAYAISCSVAVQRAF